MFTTPKLLCLVTFPMVVSPLHIGLPPVKVVGVIAPSLDTSATFTIYG